MKIIKPFRMSLLTRAYRMLGEERFGIAALVGVTLGDAPRLLSDPELWALVADELRGDTLDLALPKPNPEFLVSGYAYGTHATTPGGGVCDVAVSLAGLHKRLRVAGERPNGRSDAPRPFERLPLDWTYAYGGADHADNPLGHGADAPADDKPVPPVIAYAPAPERAADAPLPPAGFRPLDAAWPARARLGGDYDSHWLEHDCPGFPRTLDPRYFNIAPDDQQCPAASEFPDAAPYELLHLHPEHALIVGRLPALRARALVVRAGSDAPEPVPMRLTTVWFIPHRMCAVLIHHGVTPIREFDTSDLDTLLIGAEDSWDARPDDWYRQVIAWRSRHDKAVLYAMRDGDLLPARYADADASETPPPGVRQQWMRAQLSAFPNAVPEAPPRADQLLEFVERHEAEAAERRAELARMRQAGMPDDAEAVSGPPRAANADPALRGGHAQDELRKLYLRSAQHQAAPPQLGASASGALRARVAAALADGAALDGMDLTGAHLAGMDLRGARLDGALLENADLSDADLTGARLARAVLVRANLARTRIAGAALQGANLSLAACEQTDFSGADLGECIVERVRFEDCVFQGARLADTRFQSCAFLRVDFRRAQLSNLIFIDQSFDTVDFSGATISKLLLMQCQLAALRFSEADIDGLGICGARGPGPFHFDRARVSNACFVESSGLAGANFSVAILRESNFRGAALPAADFSDAWLDDCDFTGAQLPGARFRGAKFEGGSIARTDLSGADLRDADLLSGFLRGARLERADLRRANLFRANLAEIRADADTRWDEAYLVDVMRFPLAESRT